MDSDISNTFENNIFKKALQICLKVPWLLIASILIVHAVKVIENRPLFEDNFFLNAVLYFIRFFILALLSYNAYCLVLSASFPALESPVDRFKRFFGRYIVVHFSVSLFNLIPGTIILSLNRAAVWNAWITDSASVATYFMSITTMKQIFELSVLSLVGSWLAASVLKSDTTLSEALKRGRSHFFWTLSRLLVGPGLITILFTVAVSVVTLINGMERYYMSKIVSPFSIRIGLELLSPLVTVYTVVLIAVVISRAYLICVGKNRID
ncbi:MAG: hypothetical protein QNJ29_06800 [Rhizobiaceae bacterium]|nr:hypothetical protein [Rhizobiaceae bacterium]